MNILNKLPAFACGVASSAIAFALYADLSAQPINRNIVDVCANAQGTLRLTDPAVACEAGERRLRLRQPNVEAQKEEQQTQDDRRLTDLQQRLKELEERASKGRLLGSRVLAPFEVINDDGYRVLMVEDGYVWFYNATGTPVARVVMGQMGGYFEASSPVKKLRAIVGAVDNKANVFVVENDKIRLDLGRSEAGGFGLRVFEPGGKIIAGMGQSTSGDGVAFVADSQGNQRAVMSVLPKGGGILEIRNAEDKGVARLLASELGNGRMELLNNAGAMMVEAGVIPGDVGIVRAGPSSFAPGVGLLGLPGSYIIGKAAK